MRVQVVRFSAPPEGAGELASAIKETFAAVSAAKPEGIRYDYYRVADDYVAVLEMAEGAENPLLGIPAAQQLRATVGRWAAGNPAPATAEVLGAYDAR